jgi:hypothetical protein
MRSIPPAIAADAEDVVWALQTADTLWKRNERVDAIVWLRRAAQAAGEAEDDDRALRLARDAAELAEWIAQNPAATRGSGPPDAPSDAPAAGDDVDDLLGDPSEGGDGSLRISTRGEDVGNEVQDVTGDEPTPVMDTEVVFSVPPRQAAPVAPAPVVRSPIPPAPLAHVPSPIPPAPSSPPGHVPTAAEAHAGMLDPWADPEGPTRNQGTPLPGVQGGAIPPPPPPAATFDSDEVVTSAPVVAELAEPKAIEPTPEPEPPPPPPPPRRKASEPKPGPGARDINLKGLTSPAAPSPPRPPPRADAPRTAPQVSAPPKPQPPRAVPAPVPAPEPEATTASTNGVELSGIEALTDLPDDARIAFANAAVVETLAREDEVSGFALALVLEGSVDVSATIVDAAAQRLEVGAVVRSRGTIEHTTPLRLVGATDRSRVATWDETAVTEAFRTCPWVEDELRATGDRLQALVGITMGPLGERLDPSLRADFTSRLKLRALAEHEVIATKGTTTPGLLVVGAGELELLGDDGTPSGAVVKAGEFLFPQEVLRAGVAPSTVRASEGGALVLVAERGAAHELLLTCPPLLEIFAGM